MEVKFGHDLVRPVSKTGSPKVVITIIVGLLITGCGATVVTELRLLTECFILVGSAMFGGTFNLVVSVYHYYWNTERFWSKNEQFIIKQ